MSEIIEQTRLLSEKEIKLIRAEFKKQPNIIKGSCFDEFLDNIDKSGN